MTDVPTNYFSYLGSTHANWRAYTWMISETYTYRSQAEIHLLPDRVLELFTQDRIFLRSFMRPRRDDISGDAHGPFDGEINKQGAQIYEQVGMKKFEWQFLQLLDANFGPESARTDIDNTRYTFCTDFLEQMLSSNATQVFRLRTEALTKYKHECACVFDLFEEFLFVRPVDRLLKVLVIAAD